MSGNVVQAKVVPTGPRDRSRDESLRELARSYGIKSERYDAVKLLAREEVAAKHSDKVLSSEWLKWKEQSLIWRQFCEYRALFREKN